MVTPVNLALSTGGTVRAYAPAGQTWKLTEGGIAAADWYNVYAATLGTTDGTNDGGGLHLVGSVGNNSKVDTTSHGGTAWVTDSVGLALKNPDETGTIYGHATGVRVE